MSTHRTSRAQHRHNGAELRQKYGSMEIDAMWSNHLLMYSGSMTNNDDERVALVHSEIHWLVVKRRLEGGINVSGPEMSRLWQVLPPLPHLLQGLRA